VGKIAGMAVWTDRHMAQDTRSKKLTEIVDRDKKESKRDSVFFFQYLDGINGG
jgi:hypothetical protein